jgi:hypothetical protein
MLGRYKQQRTEATGKKSAWRDANSKGREAIEMKP